MNETIICLLALVFLIAFFMTGIEMAFAMAIVGTVGYAIVTSPFAGVYVLANDFYETLESYGITVVPLFLLMGQLVFNGGIATKLYDSTNKFLGHFPGGLAVATVAGAAMFKAMCGSIAATSATFASVSVPEMDRYNYDKKLSTGIVATVGTLGMLIPPAATLILLGIITQQSIGELFLAGIIPGIILTVLYMGVIIGWAKINPTIGPKGRKYPWRDRIRSAPDLVWPVVVFVIMIGGLMKGVFTPTEAGAVGLFCVLIITLVKRNISFAEIKKSTAEALRVSTMVVLLIAASTTLGHFMAATNIPSGVARFLQGLPFHRHTIFVMVLLIYLIGGSFIDDIAFLILATPILFPPIQALGYDPVWVCIVISIVIGIGSIIPPVAMCVFIVQHITNVQIGIIYRGVLPFVIALVFLVVLLFLFPKLVLFLPATMIK